MVRGLYIATMGMLLDEAKLNNLANNLANVDTTGYKNDRLAFRTYLEREIYRFEPHPERHDIDVQHIGKLEMASILDEVRVDMSRGKIEETGSPYDLAIDGEGFFAVADGENVYFTRNGNFYRDSLGHLVTSEGYRILDIRGEPVQLDVDDYIAPDGTVRGPNGEIRSTIAIYRFDNPSKLEKLGYTMFTPTEESGPPALEENARLMVGFLERSNVDPLKEMVNMITAQRHYEISQRVITTTDTLLDQAVNQIGRLR